MTIEEAAEKISDFVREHSIEDTYPREWEQHYLFPILREFAEGVRAKALLDAEKERDHFASELAESERELNEAWKRLEEVERERDSVRADARLSENRRKSSEVACVFFQDDAAALRVRISSLEAEVDALKGAEQDREGFVKLLTEGQFAEPARLHIENARLRAELALSRALLAEIVKALDSILSDAVNFAGASEYHGGRRNGVAECLSAVKRIVGSGDDARPSLENWPETKARLVAEVRASEKLTAEDLSTRINGPKEPSK